MFNDFAASIVDRVIARIRKFAQWRLQGRIFNSQEDQYTSDCEYRLILGITLYIMWECYVLDQRIVTLNFGKGYLSIGRCEGEYNVSFMMRKHPRSITWQTTKCKAEIAKWRQEV